MLLEDSSVFRGTYPKFTGVCKKTAQSLEGQGLILLSFQFAFNYIFLAYHFQDEESDQLHYTSEVCNVQEKLDTFELIYGSDLMQHWYTIDMKDMFNTLIEILNIVIIFFIIYCYECY